MKGFLIIVFSILLTGCVTGIGTEQIYYEAAKSISRDNAMTQAACWAAISEIAKTGDNSAKIGALALADKCKNQPIKIEAPRRSILDLLSH